MYICSLFLIIKHIAAVLYVCELTCTCPPKQCVTCKNVIPRKVLSPHLHTLFVKICLLLHMEYVLFDYAVAVPFNQFNL